jgi:hypothetical protein
MARALTASGVAAAWRHRGPRSELTILAYHRVYEIGREEEFPFDPELVSEVPAEFSGRCSSCSLW